MRVQVAQVRLVAMQVARLDQQAARAAIEQRSIVVGENGCMPEPREALAFGGEVVDPVAEVVHPAGCRGLQRRPGDRLPELDGERAAEREGDVTVDVVALAGGARERERADDHRPPLQPEERSELCHFPTREYLFAAILEERVDVLRRRADELLAVADVWGAIEDWLRLYDRSASEYEGMQVGLADEASPVAQACLPMKASFAALYERARSEGVVRSDLEPAQALAL